MHIRNIARSKKFQLFLVVIGLLAVGGAAYLWFHLRANSSWYTQVSCDAYKGATYLPVTAHSFAEFGEWSSAVVTATVVNPEVYKAEKYLSSPGPQLRIKQVIKGPDILHAGKVITLCPGTGAISFENDNNTVLAFLEGYNGGYWVPQSGFVGVISQSRDGRFMAEWASEGPQSVSESELRKLVE